MCLTVEIRVNASSVVIYVEVIFDFLLLLNHLPPLSFTYPTCLELLCSDRLLLQLTLSEKAPIPHTDLGVPQL